MSESDAFKMLIYIMKTLNYRSHYKPDMEALQVCPVLLF